ncbi:MAG: GTP cyclohydrolase I FolE2 [Phycisphaerales bacterium]|nr:GTP cyclohydrolase I FolE2 [Phycisphaerales bacterium]
MSIQPEGAPIPDVQASCDARQIAIDKVGVKDVTYPMRLRTPDGGEQPTVATINMYVSLPHHQKGTHMSRFLEVLNEYSYALTPECIPVIARAIRERLAAAEAHFTASFTYFIRKLAPVTGMPGLMDYKVVFECSSSAAGEDFTISVKAPATSLCPCSKEISRFGAHNQRCHIEAKVKVFPGAPTLWIEELAALIEGSASTQVYAVLKRPDEKFVTEAAYENPKFVEDIVRDLAIALEAEPRIAWYSINSENFESIHNHNAYAQITRKKQV